MSLEAISLPLEPGAKILSVRSIRGSAADDVWAVATVVREDKSDRERSSQGYHFDGKAWSAATMPARTDVVAAGSRTDGWTVGPHGTLAHWDGKAWREDRLPVEYDLLDVAAAKGQAWVAASTDELHHWDGKAWGRAGPGAVGQGRYQKVFAVGDLVVLPDSWQGEAAVTVFDGRAWKRDVAGTGTILRVAGTGPDDLWGFGSKGQVFHKTGSGWSAGELPAKGYPIDAWAAAPDDVWLVGDEGMIVHFDGKVWSAVASGTRAKIWSVWAAPGGGPVFVGGDAGFFKVIR